MEVVLAILSVAYQVCAAWGPYVACIAAGAYAEYKFGAKAAAAIQAELTAAKVELAALKAKL